MSQELRSESSSNRLQIGYLTVDDPRDRKSWSGLHYAMAGALQKHCGDVACVGPLRPIYLTAGKMIRRGLRYVGGPTYLCEHTAGVSKKLGKMTEEWLGRRHCDVLFVPVGSASIAHLHTGTPIVYFSDTTFRLIRDYYPEWRRILPSHIRMAEELERLAIKKAKRLVYASSWAALSAIRDYGAEPTKVHVAPMGANVGLPPSAEEVRRPPATDRCRLLFVGVNWERKGGDIAFETLLELERLGVPSELTVIGCRPPRHVNHRGIRVIPFLDKNAAEDRHQLHDLYRAASFLLLPTRAECQGVVICEANAYGVPCLSTRTGGVPDVVREGVNGYLFSLESRGDQYARLLRDIYQDRPRYEALRVSSRAEFDSRLNWDAWAKQILKVLWSAVRSDERADACYGGC